jgi:hypothetical protein
VETAVMVEVRHEINLSHSLSHWNKKVEMKTEELAAYIFFK